MTRTTGLSPEERRALVPDDDLRTSAGRQQLLRERRREARKGRGARGGAGRWAWLYVLLLGLGLLALLIWFLRTKVPESFEPPGGGAAVEDRIALEACTLLFGDPSGRGLAEETQFLPRRAQIEERMLELLTALFSGSRTGLVSAWPGGVAVLDLFLADDGVAYVNLGGSARATLAEGDAAEWLAMASVCRTLCDNFPEVRGVRLLIDGASQGPLRRVFPLEWTYHAAMFQEAPR